MDYTGADDGYCGHLEAVMQMPVTLDFKWLREYNVPERKTGSEGSR